VEEEELVVEVPGAEVVQAKGPLRGKDGSSISCIEQGWLGIIGFTSK
jgi:hypothetical protein